MEKIIVSYCMTCGKIKYPSDTEWEYPRNTNYKSLDDIQLSHGYCDPCGKQAIAEAMAEIASNEKLLHEMSGIPGISKEREAVKAQIAGVKK